jgi:hypothetical protein
LAGRWQTRTFLLAYLGLPITFIFCFLYDDFTTPLILLECVWLLGGLWDVLYHFLQRWRWDRDWPPLFFALGGLAEGVLLWGLVKATFLWQALGLLTIPGVDPGLTLTQFSAHYVTVWLVTFLVMLGPLKVLFLKWRFRGGQFW